MKPQYHPTYKRIHPFLLANVSLLMRQCLMYINMFHLDPNFADAVELLFYEFTNYVHKQCMKPAGNQQAQSLFSRSARLMITSHLGDTISIKVKKSYDDSGDHRIRVFDITLTGPSDKELVAVRELFQVLELTSRELIKEDFMLRDLGSWPPHIFEANEKQLRHVASKGIKELAELVFDPNVRTLIWPNPNMMQNVSKNTLRLTQMLRQVRLSTSPFVTYPAPRILKRLETQEMNSQAQRRTQTIQSGRVSRAAGHRKTKSIGSISDVNSSDRFSLASLAAVDGSATNFLASQGIQVLKVIHLEDHEPLILQMPQHVLPPCLSKITAMDFGNDATDVSLEGFLRSLVAESAKDCSVCSLRGESCIFEEHCYSFAHCTTRLDFRICKLDAGGSDTDSPICIDKACTRCKWRIPKTQLSGITLAYSFGKFIEQVLYNLVFHFIDPKTECIHLQRRNARYLQYNFNIGSGYVVRMSLVKISLKEIEIPSNHVSVTHETSEIAILRNKVVKFFDQKFDMIAETTDVKLLDFRKQLYVQEESILNAFSEMNSEYLPDFVDAKIECIEREFRHMMGVPVAPSDEENLGEHECILLALKSKPVKVVMESLREMFTFAVCDDYWPDNDATNGTHKDTSGLTHKWDLAITRMKILETTGKYELCAAHTEKDVFEEARAVSNMHINYRRFCKSCDLNITINFAAIFAILRHRHGVIEEEFATSLAQVKQWHTSGGKSNVKFWKSQDGGLIIKEADINITKKNNFLMKYLAYILFDRCPDSESAKCLPCLLVPILAHFDVKLVPSATEIGKTSVNILDSKLMVMENLFSGKQLLTQFDLKGIRGRLTNGTRYPFQFIFKRLQPESTHRRRHKKTTTLGDANFEAATNSSKNNSLYVYLHSRNLVLGALKDDIKFLAECNIVDYSLLVGVEEKGGNLIIGIVDFLCEYGLLKALESTSKRSLSVIEGAIKTMIGTNDGQNDVTIIPPEEYAKRMISAIETYFPAIPDRWTRLNTYS